MAGSLVADVVESGALARQLRFFTEGTVVAVDTLTHVARVDVQATMPDNSEVYLENVPYPSPQTPPPIHAKVRLAYTTPDPHSVYIAGVGMPGQIQNKDLTVIGNVVNSLNSLIGNITLAAGVGISVSIVSQTITIANTGLLSLNSLVGAVTLVAGTGIGLSISGQNITINNTVPAGMTNPMTTPQDIIVGGVAGAPGRLAVGVNGQVLGVSAGSIVWLNNPAGFVNPMTTLGDIIIGAGGGAAARLGIGSTNQVLTVVSGSPAWAAAAGFTNPMTTLGDVIIGGSSGAPGRLGIGSTNQVLTVVSGSPAWAAPTGAYLLNNTVITSTGVTLSNGPVNTLFAKISAGQTVTTQATPQVGDVLYIKNSANSTASITMAYNSIPGETTTVAAGKGYIMMVMAYNDVALTATNKWYTIAQF